MTRVLVADDSSTMRKIILRSLNAVGVTETSEAADGTEAWSYRVGSIVDSSPAVGPGGHVYFGSVGKYLYSLK